MKFESRVAEERRVSQSFGILPGQREGTQPYKGRRNNCREGGGPGRIPAGAPMPNLAKGLLSIDSSSSHGAFPQDRTNEWVKCSGQGRKTRGEAMKCRNLVKKIDQSYWSAVHRAEKQENS